MTGRRNITTAACICLLSLQALAHHSVAESYDLDSSIMLTGTIDHYSWVNPHAIFKLRVANGEGATAEWVVQMGSPNFLGRRGWNKDTLADGMIITVEGYQSLDGSLRTEAKTVMLPSGETLDASSGMWVESGSELLNLRQPED